MYHLIYIKTFNYSFSLCIFTLINIIFDLQAKKMKPLFGKWLDFENIHGTEEQQNLVKQAALQYLNSR